MRPKASYADIAFSGGGAGPLVTLKANGKILTLGWSGGDLPEPEIEGDQAVYPEVLGTHSCGGAGVIDLWGARGAVEPHRREL